MQLEGNIQKYNLYKVFTKRVYLPLIVIFLTTIGGVTLNQIGIIMSVTAVFCLIMEIPTGYISDRWGHRSALIFGSFLCAISVLPYLFMPNFWGGLLASILFYGGASFSSGTSQAFIHETLLSLGRDHEYVKIMGRSQSYGLLGNVVLISLVPLTYQIHPKLPFIIGFICLAICCLVTVSFKQPPRKISLSENKFEVFKILKNSLSKKAWTKLLVVFVIFGIVSAGFDQATNYRELIFKAVDIPISYYGFILAFGSLIAAFVGRHIHRLNKFSPEQFYLFDIVYICMTYIFIGLTKNPIFVIFAFTLVPTYDRTRNIIFESRLFSEFPNSPYKSTLVSILNFFPLIFDIGIPLILALLVSQFNLSFGHIVFGLMLLVVLLPILFIHNRIQIPKNP